jgi:hypothetical protein
MVDQKALEQWLREAMPRVRKAAGDMAAGTADQPYLLRDKPFGRWGEVFGDEVVAAAIDRLVRHAEVIALRGDSYLLKDRDLGRVPTATADEP